MIDRRTLERLRTFLDIATRETTPRGERENAAMHVCRILKEHGLSSVLGEAHPHAPPASGSGSGVIEFDASLLLVKETSYAFRFAYAGRDVRRVGARWTSAWLQKAHVEHIEWASKEVVRSEFGLDPNKERVAVRFRVSRNAEAWARSARSWAR